MGTSTSTSTRYECECEYEVEYLSAMRFVYQSARCVLHQKQGTLLSGNSKCAHLLLAFRVPSPLVEAPLARAEIRAALSSLETPTTARTLGAEIVTSPTGTRVLRLVLNNAA